MASALIVLTSIFSVSSARAIIQPAQDVPSFDLKDTAGNVYRLGKKTSDPVLLIFVKPHDRYTSAALQALNDIFEKYPMLEQNLQRWIILSGKDAVRHVESLEAIGRPKWSVLLDVKDEVYRAYNIIATPTVVVVGKDQRIEAINPGYDLGMENHIRKALALVLSVTLPEAVSKRPSKPNMTLQMGRRMASRGLWERALDYYTKAMEEEPLSVEAQLELAKIYIELEQADQALKILNQIATDSPGAARVGQLLERARTLKEGHSETVKPPKVMR